VICHHAERDEYSAAVNFTHIVPSVFAIIVLITLRVMVHHTKR
jgi:hypothetical protein